MIHIEFADLSIIYHAFSEEFLLFFMAFHGTNFATSNVHHVALKGAQYVRLSSIFRLSRFGGVRRIQGYSFTFRIKPLSDL